MPKSSVFKLLSASRQMHRHICAMHVCLDASFYMFGNVCSCLQVLIKV